MTVQLLFRIFAGFSQFISHRPQFWNSFGYIFNGTFSISSTLSVFTLLSCFLLRLNCANLLFFLYFCILQNGLVQSQLSSSFSTFTFCRILQMPRLLLLVCLSAVYSVLIFLHDAFLDSCTDLVFFFLAIEGQQSRDCCCVDCVVIQEVRFSFISLRWIECSGFSLSQLFIRCLLLGKKQDDVLKSISNIIIKQRIKQQGHYSYSNNHLLAPFYKYLKIIFGMGIDRLLSLINGISTYFIIFVVDLSKNMLPQDQMRFMSALFLTIPAAIALRYFPNFNITLKKCFSIILATLLQYYVFQNELFWTIALHVIIYAVIVVKGRQSGFIVTVISMIALSVYHVYRLVTSYGSTDIELSFILMLYVSKYSLFAFAYQDGAVSDDKLKHAYQREDKIVELPSFIDYLGYLQFVPTCVLNTPVDYTRYNRYMNQQGSYANIPFGQSVKKTLKDFGIGALCGGLYVIQMIYFPVKYMKTDEFYQQGHLYVLYYSFWAIALIKCKYYFAWKFSQLSVHMSGVSYEPNTKGDQFLGVQVCNPWEIETTIHIRDKISNWNMAVQEWLRKCVYDRLTLSKGTAQLVTFVISAFWHGMYGGYYLSFLFWFMQLYASGLIFKFSEQKDHPLMKLYNTFKPFNFYVIWFIWNYLFTHNGAYFHLLETSSGLKFVSFLNYFNLVIIISCIFIFTFLTKQKKQKPSTKPDQPKTQ